MPDDKEYEVHAPTTYEQGVAYSPVVGTVTAPDIDTAAEIAQQTYGPTHVVGAGGDDEHWVAPSH